MFSVIRNGKNTLSVNPMYWHSNGLTLSYTFLG